MKSILSIMALTAAVLASAQNISSYQFVRFPEQFSDFNNNQYKLRDMLKTGLQRKNFTLVEAGTAPAETCSVLTADIKNTSSMFRNRLDVIFKDCKDQPVATYRGMSLEKDFETGYREALLQAVSQLPASTSNSTAYVQAVATSEPAKTQTTMPQTPSAASQGSSAKGAAEVFTNGSLRLNKIVLSSNQFIFANPDNSVPFAVFNQSGKPDVFHVKLQTGWALGYYQGEDYVLEIPGADGSVERQVLKRQESLK